MFYSFLFPQSLNGSKKASSLLLGMRIVFGLLLMMHGIQKWSSFDMLAGGAFPDPLGIGSATSVGLAIFAELFCSIAFIVGFLYRLSMIPMIFTMLVAFIFVHKGSIAEGELAAVYLLLFVALYIAGPGKYSLDDCIARALKKNKQ